ncbi:MAG: transglycosylase SLT domain-containing protein [bacterium]
MKKLINNKEIRKLVLWLFIFVIAILLGFSTIFIVIGDFAKNRNQQKLNEKIVEIFDLNDKLNDLNEDIVFYESEVEKLELIAQLKNELNIIFIDRNYFNVENINEEHLFFMENQRMHYDIPKHIFYRLILAESGFKMYDNTGNVLRSEGGAIGYVQMLTSTFNWINDKYDLNLSDVTNPYDNIAAGAFYLSKRKEDIEKMFPNKNENYKWRMTIASYNAGIGDVMKAGGIPKIRYHNSSRFNYGDPNTETINYVNFITKNFISDEQLLAML